MTDERSSGFTASEQHLIKLAQQSFLRFWSFPNVFTDKALRGVPAGKELCDLLIVCGDHILIFSDKHIGWPQGDENIAWGRWAKRSILKSADQVKGAIRWIEEFPSRLFLDPACRVPLPIALPPVDRRKIHGIVVARGSADACRKYFGGGSGSLMVCPSITGSDHINPASPEFAPFSVGDINPDGPFIHVLDEVALEVALSELDTVTDFVQYLDAKAEFARSGRLISAAGEEELISYYVTHTDARGNHAFTHPENRRWRPDDFVALEEGFYSGLLKNPQYLRKQAANKVSYLWDELIEHLSSHMTAGTLVDLDGEHDKPDQERAIRFMALEHRILRRSHSEAILGALKGAGPNGRFFRAMMPSPGEGDTTFFVLVLAKPSTLDVSDEDYRLFRRHCLYAYGMGLLDKFQTIRRVVGVAMQSLEDRGSSEDLMLLEPPEWTEALSTEARALCKELGILVPGKATETKFLISEYPRDDSDPPQDVSPLQLSKRQKRRERGKRRLGQK